MDALKKCIKSCSRQSTSHEVNECEKYCNIKFLQAAEDELKRNMEQIAFRIAKSAIRDPHKKYMEDVYKMGRSITRKSHTRKRTKSRKRTSRKHY